MRLAVIIGMLSIALMVVLVLGQALGEDDELPEAAAIPVSAF
jgi:hypothetical protein